MPKIRRGGGGSGTTGPSPEDQAVEAHRARLRLEDARGTVQVMLKDTLTVLGPLPIRLTGDAVDEPSEDAVEKVIVINMTVPIISGLAASRPADPGRPTLHIATDSGAHSSFDGTTWRTI